jgi:hypothetical protein
VAAGGKQPPGEEKGEFVRRKRIWLCNTCR